MRVLYIVIYVNRVSHPLEEKEEVKLTYLNLDLYILKSSFFAPSSFFDYC